MRKTIMRGKDFIIDLSNETELSKILYRIGYYFYKCRGIRFDFELKNNIVYAIREDGKKKVIIKIKNNRICKVNDYLLELFSFPVTEIIVDGWEKYLFEC